MLQGECLAALCRIASAIESLETVACRQSQVERSERSGTSEDLSLSEKALLLIFRHRVTCPAEIARRLGVHRSTISRMKHLQAAIFYVEVLSDTHQPDPKPAPDDE